MIKNTIKYLTIISLILLTFNGFCSNNITYNLTGTFSGNGVGMSNVWATTPYSIGSVNPILYVNPNAISNYIVPTALLFVPDSSGNGNTMSNGLTSVIYLPQAIGGQPGISMQATWAAGGYSSPTTSFALTNGMWGKWGNSNYSITMTYQDPMELGGSGVTPLLNGGVQPFLWQAGNGAVTGPSTYAYSFFSAADPNCGSSDWVMGNSQIAYAPLPLHHQPVIVTFNLLNGYGSLTINGMTVVPTNMTSGQVFGSVTDTLFTIGCYYDTTLGGFKPSFGAANIILGDVIVTTNGLSPAQISAIQTTEMQKYGIGTGIQFVIFSDSIGYGILSGINSNLSYQVSSEIPFSSVDNPSLSGQSSSTIYLEEQNWIGQKTQHSGTRIAIALCPVNDIILYNTSLTLWETNIINMATLARNNGWIYYQCTCQSFAGETGGSFSRSNMNNFIITNTNLFNGIIRLDLDPIMGTNGSYAVNTAYWVPTGGQNVHPSGLGYQELNSQEIYPFLQQQLYGINGISSYNHVPNSVSVGSSPWNFTNTLNNGINCFITDSAAYSVALDGQTIYNASGASLVPLAPTNFLTITYLSTAPTMTTNSYP